MTIHKMEQSKAMWDDMAEYLMERSQEICQDNGCTEEEHFCGSNVYITENCALVDICCPDFFQGWGSWDEETYGQLAVIPLPFDGNGDDLKREVEENLPWD